MIVVLDMSRCSPTISRYASSMVDRSCEVTDQSERVNCNIV